MEESAHVHLWKLTPVNQEVDPERNTSLDMERNMMEEDVGRVDLSSYHELRPFLNNYSRFSLIHSSEECVSNVFANRDRNALWMQEQCGQVCYLGQAIEVVGSLQEMHFHFSALREDDIPELLRNVMVGESGMVRWNAIVHYGRMHLQNARWMKQDFIVTAVLCIVMVVLLHGVLLFDLVRVAYGMPMREVFWALDTLPFFMDVLLPFLIVVVFLFVKPGMACFRRFRVRWAIWRFRRCTLPCNIIFYGRKDDMLVFRNTPFE